MNKKEEQKNRQKRKFSTTSTASTRRTKKTIIIATTIALIITILQVTITTARTEVIKPTYYNDQTGSATDEFLAYDQYYNTSSKIISSDNNVSWYNFDIGSHNDNEEIINTTLTFTINTSGFTNDEWALIYSNDSGTTTFYLRNPSNDNLTKTNLSYLLLNNGDPGGWVWSDFATKLRAIVQTINNTDDKAVMNLFDISLTVIFDGDGPNITLISPDNNILYDHALTVNFTFNATDDFNGIANCSLIINNQINKTNNTITNTQNTFSTTLGNGIYNWSIKCFDNSSANNPSTSETRVVKVDDAPPFIELISPDDGATADNNIVSFTFKTIDVTNMTNCSLYVDNNLTAFKNSSNLNWPTGVDELQAFLTTGTHQWYINCSDSFGRYNQSTTRTINVSPNEPPRIIVDTPPTINPVLGGNKSFTCNATITDPQGYLSLSSVKAYFHREDILFNSPDIDALHYTNDSCSEIGINSTTASYSCEFTIPYYARSGDWRCTFEATDNGSLTSTGFNNSFISELYSFSITPNYLSYGGVTPGNISNPAYVTVKNLGNTVIDLAVTGYAVSEGDGKALVCDVGETPLENERYSDNPSALYDEMITVLNSTAINYYLGLNQLDSFDLAPRNSTFSGEKNLFFRIKLGIPSDGTCNGYLTIVAIQG